MALGLKRRTRPSASRKTEATSEPAKKLARSSRADSARSDCSRSRALTATSSSLSDRSSSPAASSSSFEARSSSLVSRASSLTATQLVVAAIELLDGPPEPLPGGQQLVGQLAGGGVRVEVGGGPIAGLEAHQQGSGAEPVDRGGPDDDPAGRGVGPGRRIGRDGPALAPAEGHRRRQIGPQVRPNHRRESQPRLTPGQREIGAEFPLEVEDAIVAIDGDRRRDAGVQDRLAGPIRRARRRHADPSGTRLRPRSRVADDARRVVATVEPGGLVDRQESGLAVIDGSLVAADKEYTAGSQAEVEGPQHGLSRFGPEHRQHATATDQVEFRQRRVVAEVVLGERDDRPQGRRDAEPLLPLVDEVAVPEPDGQVDRRIRAVSPLAGEGHRLAVEVGGEDLHSGAAVAEPAGLQQQGGDAICLLTAGESRGPRPGSSPPRHPCRSADR